MIFAAIVFRVYIVEDDGSDDIKTQVSDLEYFDEK